MNNEQLTPRQFTEEIENRVRRFNLNYMEAILRFCDDNDINTDVSTLSEFLKPLITPVLKQKLAENALDLHLLHKTVNRLKFK